jgi:Resolvase, N terminal domain
MVTRLDRLARSTRDLLNILHTLGERGIGFKSLADAWADTTRLSCDGDACPAERARLQPRYRCLAHTVTPREIGLSSAFRKPLDRFLPLMHG